MLRFYYIIIRNLIRGLYYIPGMNYIIRHKDEFSSQKKYGIVQRIVRIMKRTGRIHTQAYGTENLPEIGGYIMYPNHQGKYDALGIINTHKLPCSFVMDAKKASTILVKQVMGLVDGLGMELSDIRQSLSIIKEVGNRVKDGDKFIIFPEGGYDHNHNSVNDFKAGSFKSAFLAHCPIVPVALVDSYKVFEGFSLRRVETKVVYLEPIPYENYKNLNTRQVADLVKDKIERAIRQYSMSET